MKQKLKKIVAYIFRSWEDEPSYTHPLNKYKILPPFLLELLGYLIVPAMLLLFFYFKEIVAYILVLLGYLWRNFWRILKSWLIGFAALILFIGLMQLLMRSYFFLAVMSLPILFVLLFSLYIQYIFIRNFWHNLKSWLKRFALLLLLTGILVLLLHYFNVY
jgi:hypothetical protein